MTNDGLYMVCAVAFLCSSFSDEDDLLMPGFPYGDEDIKATDTCQQYHNLGTMAPSVSEIETTSADKLAEVKRTESQAGTRVIPEVRGPKPSHIHVINSSYRESLIRSITLTSTLPRNGLPSRSSVGSLVNLRNRKMNYLNLYRT